MSDWIADIALAVIVYVLCRSVFELVGRLRTSRITFYPDGQIASISGPAYAIKITQKGISNADD